MAEEEERVLALFESNWFGVDTSQRRVPKLSTIPSGKQVPENAETIITEPPMKRTGKRGKSKSLSELQFEELKGFMDLGFTFPEGESDRRLLSLLPALQNKGLSEEEEEGFVSRPYLSESWVWSAMDDRKNLALQRRLKGWKIPVSSDAVDMKLHLRHWAHSVASSVR